MGSFVVSLTGAVDDRIHAVFLTGGGDLDGPGGYWDSSKMTMCQSGPYRALAFLGDRPAVLFTLQARRGPTFIFNGTADTVVAIPEHGPAFFNDLRQRVIALNGPEKNVFTTYFDEGASHRPAWVTPRAAIWLDHQLAFRRLAREDHPRLAHHPHRRLGGEEPGALERKRAARGPRCRARGHRCGRSAADSRAAQRGAYRRVGEGAQRVCLLGMGAGRDCRREG